MYTTCIKNIMAAIKWSIPCDHRFPPFISFIRHFCPVVVCGVGGGYKRKTIKMVCEWLMLCVYLFVCGRLREEFTKVETIVCVPKNERRKMLDNLRLYLKLFVVVVVVFSFRFTFFQCIAEFLNLLLFFLFLNFSWGCF